MMMFSKEISMNSVRHQIGLTTAILSAATLSALISTSAVNALDLNVGVDLGDLAEANVSLSLGSQDSSGGGGLGAGVDVGIGGNSGGGAAVNVAVGGNGGVSVNVGGGTGNGGGSTGGGILSASTSPDDTGIIPDNSPNRRGDGATTTMRCAAGGNVPSLIGSEVVDKKGILLGWIAGAEAGSNSRLSKIWYQTPETTCRSLQGGMALVGDRVRVNAMAADIR
jgi:hypothetical protein